MEIRANDLYRTMLQQCKADLAEADVQSQARALVDFAEFVAADASNEGAAAIGDLLRKAEIASWDRPWVLTELGRSAFDALRAWQKIADEVVMELEESGEVEAVRELRARLAEPVETPLQYHTQQP